MKKLTLRPEGVPIRTLSGSSNKLGPIIPLSDKRVGRMCYKREKKSQMLHAAFQRDDKSCVYNIFMQDESATSYLG